MLIGGGVLRKTFVELEGVDQSFALSLTKFQFVYIQPFVKTPIFT